MKRFIAVILLSLFLAFGALFAAMSAGFVHSAHGSMAAAPSCMTAFCPASENDGPTAAMDCFSHCLSAAVKEFPASPVLPALFFIVLLLMVSGRSLSTVFEDNVRRFSDIIGRLLLRQRLSTVVLRN
ncbi:hypothetical protein HY633_03130 [Candidatus Uhrbacteria bacterium]|nr:hypothetical protein [Candidatus Uhrbacteria bacterium]